MNEEEGRKKREKKGAPGWVVTYGDMMSLLLTFFIMLVSYSNMDIAKYKRLLNSLQGAFNVSESKRVAVKEEINPEAAIAAAQATTNEDRRSERKKALASLLKESLSKMNLAGKLDIVETDQGVMLAVQDYVMFDSAKTLVKEGAKSFLSTLLPILQKSPYEMIVEGHTDDTPIQSSSYPSNWELSTARAGSVVRYFIEEGKLPASKFMAVGFAETRPLVPNDTPENRSKNRRVNIVFVIP